MRKVLLLSCLLLAACERGPGAPPVDQPPPLAELLAGDAEAGYARATGSRDFSFPADHGPHAGYRNEWWYLTGNLDGEDGRRFGYELTLFRFLLAPEPPAGGDDWRSHAVFVGHFAVTDVAEEAFHVAERVARGAGGLAGATSDPVRVWLYDWSLRTGGSGEFGVNWQLVAHGDEAGIELTLVPQRAPLLQGEGGLSQKSAEPGNASWYYSVPRLKTTGVLRVGARRHEVSGLSWLDREWSTSALAADQAGWDWFALQLDDGSDLMYYNLRRLDGSRDPYSAGSLRRADGSVVRLGADDVELEVLDRWDSPAGGSYPSGWQLRVPGELLDLRVRPVLEAQELDTFVRYWEGAVDAYGTRGTTRIGGRGYVELTGYAEGATTLRP